MIRRSHFLSVPLLVLVVDIEGAVAGAGDLRWLIGVAAGALLIALALLGRYKLQASASRALAPALYLVILFAAGSAAASFRAGIDATYAPGLVLPVIIAVAAAVTPQFGRSRAEDELVELLGWMYLGIYLISRLGLLSEAAAANHKQAQSFVLIAFWFWLVDRSRTRAAIYVALSVTAFATYSAGTYFVVFAFVLAGFLWIKSTGRQRSAWRMLIVATLPVAGLLGSLAMASAIEDATDSLDPSDAARLEIWAEFVPSTSAMPIWRGFDQPTSIVIQLNDAPTRITAHNDYIQVLNGGGIIGLVALVAMIWVPLRLGLRDRLVGQEQLALFLWIGFWSSAIFNPNLLSPSLAFLGGGAGACLLWSVSVAPTKREHPAGARAFADDESSQ